MPHIRLFSLFLFTLCLFIPQIYSQQGSAKAADNLFSHGGIANDAKRYEAYVQKTSNPGKRSALIWRRAADLALKSGNIRQALSPLLKAVVADNTHSQTWLTLARTILAIQPANSNERYNLPSNASSAAYIAYRRAKSTNARAVSLATLGTALARRSYWRPALMAYKSSLALNDDPAIHTIYQKLLTEHGFSITDYDVASDSATPRLCIKFSDPLSKSLTKPEQYISINGKDPASASIEAKKICIDGLKHGERYQVLVRKGLPSNVDETLAKSAELSIYVRDRSPAVRFSGRNYVLPNKGQQGIPLTSVNAKKVNIEIYRIGDRALSSALTRGNLDQAFSNYDLRELEENSGQKIWNGDIQVRSRLNQDVTTAFPVSKAVPDLKPGAYVMIATPEGKKDRDWKRRATQWFIVSDLGLTALTGSDGLHAFVRSIATANPSAKIKLRLIARNNEVLGETASDTNGYGRFEAGLTRGKGSMSPALLMAESDSGDFAFLDLTHSAFDLTDRGVKGRAAPGPLDAFIFTERGVYKPGADIHITALLRDQNAKAAPRLPLTLIMQRPDGVEHARFTMQDEGLGGRAVTHALGHSAMTGTWRLYVHADPKAAAIGETSFLVEDYVPERLALDLNSTSKELSSNQKTSIDIKGTFLYGPPAVDLAVEGEFIIRPRNSGPRNFSDYQVGIADEEFSPMRTNLRKLPETDAKGMAKIPLKLPTLPETSKLLEANITLRLREPGGRTIERAITMPINPAREMIAIKPEFDKGELKEDSQAAFNIVMIGKDGNQIPKANLKWEIQKITRQYQWYSHNGSWNYEPVTFTARIANGTINAPASGTAKIARNLGWGRYKLEITTSDKEGIESTVTSIDFNAGWWGEETADTPEMLDIALDARQHKIGDVARLSIQTKNAGKALIAIISNGLKSMKLVDVPKGGATIPLTIEKSWAPGAYVTTMFYRPMDTKAKRMPNRSIGVKWLNTDAKSRTIGIEMTIPEKIESAAELSIPVKLLGLDAGEEARITIAAVDVGILNLTRYKSPAPENWYYAQRRMGTEVRDLYGRLIDGMKASSGAIRSGGDAGPAGMSTQGSPPVEAPLALFSGIIKIGADGTAKATFDLPEFNGSVRIMAVAWSADKLGHSEQNIIVRDPVALLATGPRFLTLGDKSRLHLDFHNIEGESGDYNLNLTSTNEFGAETEILSRTISLNKGERKTVEQIIDAKQMGKTTYAIHLQGHGNIDITRSISLTVNPMAPDIKRRTIASLSAGGGKLILTKDLLTGLIPEQSLVTVNVGPYAGLDVPGLLVALDRYPHGCAEQTTSRALPLLYLNQVAAKAGITGESKARLRVQKAIDRLFEMQNSSGAFGLWGPGNADLWLTAYVTDFLTRAKEQGYKVRKMPHALALDRLKNFVSYASDFENGGEAIAYSLYVLARNGRAPIGDLRYYADARIDNFATPLAKAQLGAALAMYGDKARATTAFNAAMGELDSQTQSIWRRDYGSNLRDGAATLTLVSESGINPQSLRTLASLVTDQRNRKSHTSTQEQAWMLLAARGLQETSHNVTLNINGKTRTGSYAKAFTMSELETNPMTIINSGSGNLQAVITVTGASTTAEPQSSQGFRIKRQYYSMDGKMLDLTGKGDGEGAAANAIKQNDRFVVVLNVDQLESRGGRVLLIDRLPAGLEIENPRLVTSADLGALSWLKKSDYPKHSEFRKDRFTAAFDLFARSKNNKDKPITVAYIVRAVTPGDYRHPPATIEDMYRPERFARTISGDVRIDAAD